MTLETFDIGRFLAENVDIVAARANKLLTFPTKSTWMTPNVPYPGHAQASSDTKQPKDGQKRPSRS